MKLMLKVTLVCAVLALANKTGAQSLSTVDNSLNAGKVEWLPRQHNLPNVPFGVPVSREFEVKNISAENLLILEAKSSCHCTTVEWPKEPVPPGQSIKIKVTYDAMKEGDFYRIIAVLTNFDTNQSVPIALTGKVAPKLVGQLGQ